MPGRKRGRLTAIIVNIFGTILTIYLLLQFYSAFYALAIVLFSLSVSATQCKSKLKITTPVLFINLCVASIGAPTALYLFYVALTAESMAPSLWVTPITISIYVGICLLNVIIIRNLHFSEWGGKPHNNDEKISN
jgi:hypothetical protein